MKGCCSHIDGQARRSSSQSYAKQKTGAKNSIQIPFVLFDIIAPTYMIYLLLHAASVKKSRILANIRQAPASSRDRRRKSPSKGSLFSDDATDAVSEFCPGLLSINMRLVDIRLVERSHVAAAFLSYIARRDVLSPRRTITLN